MQLGRIHGDLDIGFTDLLDPRGGVAKENDLVCSATGSSRVVTIAAGVVWCPDNAGTFTGLANSMIRQVYGGGTLTLAVNTDVNQARIDIICARPNASWGGAPEIVVRAGSAIVLGASIYNGKGNEVATSGFAAGDVPLAIVGVPPNSGNPPAFSGTGSANDLRRIAAERVTPGVTREYDGVLPPCGWKWHDGQEFNRKIMEGLFGQVGITHGVGDGSGAMFNVGDSRARVLVGADNFGSARGSAGRMPFAASAFGQNGGEDRHALTETELAPHKHAPRGADFAALAPSGFIDRQVAAGGGFHVLGDVGNVGSFDQTQSFDSTGGGVAHNNLPPYHICARIIKF